MAYIVPNPRDATNLMAPSLRYAVLACESLLSRGVLHELISAPPVAVVFASRAPLPPAPMIPVSAPTGVAGFLTQVRWPTIQIPPAGLDAGYADLATVSPDLLILACFPHVLDARWLRLAGKGVLNVHPSLLPAYRGPSPLHWQRACGEPSTGVTVHWATESVDAGPIVAQASIPLSADDDNGQVVARQAAAAGALLRALFPALAALDAPQRTVLAGRAQDEGAASWFGWPPRA